jgi:hypothetical protein
LPKPVAKKGLEAWKLQPFELEKEEYWKSAPCQFLRRAVVRNGLAAESWAHRQFDVYRAHIGNEAPDFADNESLKLFLRLEPVAQAQQIAHQFAVIVVSVCGHDFLLKGRDKPAARPLPD